jgi:hypothetical protein
VTPDFNAAFSRKPSVPSTCEAYRARIEEGLAQLLREHLRPKRGGYRIEEEDHPKKMPFGTAQLSQRRTCRSADSCRLALAAVAGKFPWQTRSARLEFSGRVSRNKKGELPFSQRASRLPAPLALRVIR